MAAAERRLWVLLGSTHPLTPPHRPHNCVYVINDRGQVADRYDKRFCTGVLEPEACLDLAHYSPGNRSTIFEIDGYRCAALICYDYRFPELYRDLKRQGVEVVFQSFHNARRDRQTHETGNVWKDIVPATMMCHAACKRHFWISHQQPGPILVVAELLVQPNGLIAGRLELHEPGVLIGDVEFSQEMGRPRSLASAGLDGQLHSGCLVDDLALPIAPVIRQRGVIRRARERAARALDSTSLYSPTLGPAISASPDRRY